MHRTCVTGRWCGRQFPLVACLPVAMVNRRIAMRFGERSLGHLSLVFGLLAVGTLSLSVATDFWLFTVEALDPSMLLGDMTTPVVNPYAPPLETADDMPSDAVYSDYNDLNETGGMEDMGSEIDMNMYPIVFAKLHSGLWRSCQYYDNQGKLGDVTTL